MDEREPKFKVGQRFKTRNKLICTVVDIHKTYNLSGKLVKLRYVATHEFMGQTITDSDVVEATIARNLIK